MIQILLKHAEKLEAEQDPIYLDFKTYTSHLRKVIDDSGILISESRTCKRCKKPTQYPLRKEMFLRLPPYVKKAATIEQLRERLECCSGVLEKDTRCKHCNEKGGVHLCTGIVSMGQTVRVLIGRGAQDNPGDEHLYGGDVVLQPFLHKILTISGTDGGCCCDSRLCRAQCI